MTRTSISTEEGRAWQLARIPMGRLGQPDDIAGVVLFLCSSDADYITGHILVADGGWTPLLGCARERGTDFSSSRTCTNRSGTST